VPPPSSIRPEIPPALDAIVARALERERDRRYPTAEAMADELEQLLRQFPCPSHAIPRLLDDLFGEEGTDDTPDIPDLPDLADLPDPSGEPAPTPGPRAVAARAADGGEDPIEIEISPLETRGQSESAEPPSLSPEPPSLDLGDPSRTRRRLVVFTATATLAGCLAWAVVHGKPGLVRALAGSGVSPRAAVTGPPPGVAPAPASAPSPPPDSPAHAGEEAADDDTAPAGERTGHARPAKKRAAHRISNDVTIDPFK